jgi:uncharacterized membrane protein YdjX (TVP38/TMEM64 family)
VLVCAALAAAASSDTLHDLLFDLLKRAEPAIAANPITGVTLFVGLAALSTLLAFFSAAVIIPVAVYTWGEPVSMLLLWVGWLLGGMAAYGIGRALGRALVRALVSPAAFARFESRISRELPFGFVVLFQLAVPSEIPGYLLGLARYPFGRFVLALGLAELPFAVATVYLGASFMEQRVLTLLLVGIGGAAFSVWALRLLKTEMGERTGM